MTGRLLHIPLRARLVSNDAKTYLAIKQILIRLFYKPASGFLCDQKQERLPARRTRTAK